MLSVLWTLQTNTSRNSSSGICSLSSESINKVISIHFLLTNINTIWSRQVERIKKIIDYCKGISHWCIIMYNQILKTKCSCALIKLNAVKCNLTVKIKNKEHLHSHGNQRCFWYVNAPGLHVPLDWDVLAAFTAIAFTVSAVLHGSTTSSITPLFPPSFHC